MPPKRKRVYDVSGYSGKKRLYTNAKRKYIRRRFGRAGPGRLNRAIKRGIIRLAETKKTRLQLTTNLALEHNEFRIIKNNVLELAQGAGENQRVGQRCYGQYIKFKMYFENQQYRPLCYYTVLVLRDKSNPSRDLADGENIFEGVTTTKTLDYIDYDKFEVVYQKKIKVGSMALATSTRSGMNPPGYPDGTASIDTSNLVTQNVTKFHSFSVRLNKNIDYGDGNNTVPVKHKYALAVIPYNNYSTGTSGGTWPVGHVSVVSEFVFKDP